MPTQYFIAGALPVTDYIYIVCHFVASSCFLKIGLGFWSEQASESVHADLEKARADIARAFEDPKYAEYFLKLGVKYNSNQL